ncbi:MAG: prepilin-type N-terminal cleavage/methylation domain-containing protein [bacterium]
MKKRKFVDQSGLTLLEVLIAMLIMSIALLLLLNMAMVALDGNDWSNKTTIATQLMQEKLEQLRNSSSPASGADTTLAVSRRWVVSNAGSHLRQVDIYATWEDISANWVTDSLSTFIKTNSL